jgi:hypothetical protein
MGYIGTEELGPALASLEKTEPSIEIDLRIM